MGPCCRRPHCSGDVKVGLAVGVGTALLCLSIVVVLDINDMANRRDLVLSEWESAGEATVVVGQRGSEDLVSKMKLLGAAFTGRRAEPFLADGTALSNITAQFAPLSAQFHRLHLYRHVYDEDRAAFEAAAGGPIRSAPPTPTPFSDGFVFPQGARSEYFPMVGMSPATVVNTTFLMDFANRTSTRWEFLNELWSEAGGVGTKSGAPIQYGFGVPTLQFFQAIPPSSNYSARVDGYVSFFLSASVFTSLFTPYAGYEDLTICVHDVTDGSDSHISLDSSDPQDLTMLASAQFSITGRVWEARAMVSQDRLDDAATRSSAEVILFLLLAALSVALGGGMGLLAVARRRAAAASASAKVSRQMQEAHKRLLQVMNHELRNPLTVASCSMELLQADVGPSEPLAVLERAIRSMNVALDDMLNVHLAQSTELTPYRRAVELAAFLRDVRHHAASMSRMDARLVVRASILSSVPRVVELDSARTRQLLVELVHFAQEHTPFSFVDVVVSSSDETLFFVLCPLAFTSSELPAVFTTPGNDSMSLHLESLDWSLTPDQLPALQVHSKKELFQSTSSWSSDEDVPALLKFKSPEVCQSLAQALGGVVRVVPHPRRSRGEYALVLALPLRAVDFMTGSPASFSPRHRTTDRLYRSRFEVALPASPSNVRLRGSKSMDMIAIAPESVDHTRSRVGSTSSEASCSDATSEVVGEGLFPTLNATLSTTPDALSDTAESKPSSSLEGTTSTAGSTLTPTGVRVSQDGVSDALSAAVSTAFGRVDMTHAEVGAGDGTSTGGDGGRKIGDVGDGGGGDDGDNGSDDGDVGDGSDVGDGGKVSGDGGGSGGAGGSGSGGDGDGSGSGGGSGGDGGGDGARISAGRSENGSASAVSTPDAKITFHVSGGASVNASSSPQSRARDRPRPMRRRRSKRSTKSPRQGAGASLRRSWSARWIRSLCVVVVDDEPMICRMVLQHLQRLGVPRRLSLDDGEDLLEKLAMMEVAPSLILLDIVMQRSDGVTVLKALRSDPRWNDVPVYAMTSNVENVELFRKSGFDGLLGKPFGRRHLRQVLVHAAGATGSSGVSAAFPSPSPPPRSTSPSEKRRSERFIATHLSPKFRIKPKPVRSRRRPRSSKPRHSVSM